MVMVTRSAFKKSSDSFSSDVSDLNNINPPWCSAGRERRKPRKCSPARAMKSSYNIRDNIWEYLNNHSNNYYRGRSKKCAPKYMRRVSQRYTFCFLLLMIVFTMLFLSFNKTIKDDILHSLYGKTNLISWVDTRRVRVDEECCSRMQDLSLALARAEYLLKNTIRKRRTMLSSQMYRTETKMNRGSYMGGASAEKGSDTKEWGGRVALWGIVPLWRAAPSPDTILALRKPTPSDCWPFRGSTGEVNIHLPRKAMITSISLEHVRPDTAQSAPNHFIVYGILENGTWIKAAEGIYDYNKPAKQYYSLDNKNSPLQRIVFRVLSNHGNPKYTCVYRVHVFSIT